MRNVRINKFNVVRQNLRYCSINSINTISFDHLLLLTFFYHLNRICKKKLNYIISFRICSQVISPNGSMTHFIFDSFNYDSNN